MWHWEISVKTMPQKIFISALFPPQRPHLCRGEAKKKARKRRPPWACYFVIMDTQQEPLRRREVSVTKKGARK